MLQQSFSWLLVGLFILFLAMSLFYATFSSDRESISGLNHKSINYTKSTFPEDVVLTSVHNRADVLWFQQPPFAPIHPDYLWTEVSISNAEALGDHATCDPESSYFPCCTGISHNGGDHRFGGCQNMPPPLALSALMNRTKSFRSGLDFIRAVGNRTLVMVGDSVGHQEFMALYCACRLWKECKVISGTTIQLSNPACPASTWRARMGKRETVILQTSDNITSTLHYIMQYQPCMHNLTWDAEDQKKIIDLNPDILILPVLGAHYAEHANNDLAPKSAYDNVRAIFGGPLVQKLLEEDKLVINVEATQQHDPQIGGDYWGGRAVTAVDLNLSSEQFAQHGGKEGCFPIVYEADQWKVVAYDYVTNEHAWKGKLTRYVMENKLNLSIWWSNMSKPCKRRQIAWIPLAELTRSRPDLHPGLVNATCSDSTHICYSALFWVPFVDSITRTLVECGKHNLK